MDGVKAYLSADEHPRWYSDYIAWLRIGFERLGVLEMRDSPERDDQMRVSIIDIEIGDHVTRVWYDWSDFGDQVHWTVIRNGDLYFKVECQAEHIEKGILPIGHSTSAPDVYLERRDELLSKTEDIHDVFFNGRITNPDRIGAAMMIAADESIDSAISLSPFRGRLKVPDHLSGSKLDPLPFLEEMKKAKINLLLPGIGELTMRITPTLGIGACALMPRLETVLPGDHDGCWIEVERDYSDMLEKIHYYLDHEVERLEIAWNGLQYYERWLSPEAQALHVINTVKSRTGD